MSFLLGVNDSFAHARGQILLMKPIPGIDDTFSLLLQDETQRVVGIQSIPALEMACAVPQQSIKGKPSRKERPLCSHCNLHGHTKEKYFKLHGYPPGFKKSTVASAYNDLDSAPTDTNQQWSSQRCQQVFALL